MHRMRILELQIIFAVVFFSTVSHTSDIRISTRNVLEVFDGNIWGTVCDDFFDQVDADVACRELGYRFAYFWTIGEVDGSPDAIHLDSVNCNGSETSLLHCQHEGLGVHACDHSEDVGLSCRQEDIRIADGNLLETFIGPSWGTVCGDHFGQVEADVACRELGYKHAHFWTMGEVEGAPDAINMFNCNGSETSLLQCDHKSVGPHECDHTEDVGLICYQEDVRIINANLLEVFDGNTWGTVCDDYFGQVEADVVCREFGYRHGQFWTIGEVEGAPDAILLDSVICNGDETSLLQCHHKGLGVHDCDHSEDVGISCHQEDVRITKESLLEVFNGTTWGTACDDYFGQHEADLACRELGYSFGRFVTIGKVKGAPDAIHLFSCNGSESSLLQCQHEGLGGHPCDHDQDVGIFCQEDDARITNGYLLEVFNGTHSGTVCNASFGQVEADVTCRHLGYSYGRYWTIGKVDGALDAILMDSVNCIGNELSLLQCQHNVIGGSDCSHTADVGLSCHREGDVRISNANLLEVFDGNIWGTVCDDHFDQTDADVACRELGYSFGKYWSRGAVSGAPNTIHMDSVNCTGNERSLLQCQHRGFGVHDCDQAQNVGLSCHREGAVRISNANLLEVFDGNTWGTVCDDSFGQPDADVACKELGYRRGRFWTIGSVDRAPKAIHLDDLACTGRETSLLQCQHPGIGRHNCRHSEDVGLSCRQEDVRNTNGSLLEVFHGNRWGTVCDDGFGPLEAHVACRALGYRTYANYTTSGVVRGATSAPTHLDNVDCNGNETSLFQCLHNGVGVEDCSHGEDVGISCYQEEIEKCADGSCYRRFTAKINWTEADASCKRMSTTLASPRTEAQWRAIYDMSRSGRTWIGFRQIPSEGPWRDMAGNDVTQQVVAKLKSDDSGQDCGYANDEWDWPKFFGDLSCVYSYGFICEL